MTFLLSYTSEKYPIGPCPTTPEIVAINKRIEVSTNIIYEDKTLNLSGEVIKETRPTNLNIHYILGRRNNQWMLIDFFRVN